MKVALAGIVKNEFPYLLEWIAHHKSIGIDHFIIANHGSIDGTTELLEAFQKLGFLTTFFIPAETEAPQLPAYKKIVEDYGYNYDWMGFLDADEFLIPEENTSLKQILKDNDERIGGVLFNWAIYGSSFQKYPDQFELPSPVTARFTWRAKKEFEINRLAKSFVRPHTVALDKLIPYNDAHKLPLKSQWNHINSALKKIEYGHEVSWENARINHYVIKSNWEFANRKMPNGTVAWGNNIYRDWLFFQEHDVNQVFEPVPLYLQQQRDNQINYLKKELQKTGYLYPTRSSYVTKHNDYDYQLKSIVIENGHLILSGWMVDPCGKSYVGEIDVFIKHGEAKIFPSIFKITKSAEAKEKYPFSSIRSGFEVHFPLPEVNEIKPIELYEIKNTSKEERIAHTFQLSEITMK